MEKRRKRTPSLSLAFWLISFPLFVNARAVPTLAVPATTFDGKLAARVVEFSVVNRPAIEALLELACKFQLPLGVEYVDSQLVQRPLNLHIRDASVRDAVETIVNRFPEYRVSFSGGVVDVYSPKARAERSNILNTVIGSFSVTRANAVVASSQLQAEIFAKMNPGVGFGGDTAWGGELTEGPGVTLHLTNRKAYEILNAIVAQHGSALWLPVVRPESLTTFDWNRWAIYTSSTQSKDAIIEHLRGAFSREP